MKIYKVVMDWDGKAGMDIQEVVETAQLYKFKNRPYAYACAAQIPKEKAHLTRKAAIEYFVKNKQGAIRNMQDQIELAKQAIYQAEALMPLAL